MNKTRKDAKMEQLNGPVIEEVLKRAHDQEHAKHEANGREIGLLWERVNGIAEDHATRGQLLVARQVSHARHQELKDQVKALSNRLERAMDNAAEYREALELALTSLATGTIENAERLDALEYTPPASEPDVPTRSFWDHLRGWG